MAYPPTIPPATRTNATPQLDTHPADHNAISAALTDIVTKVTAEAVLQAAATAAVATLQPTAWTAFPFAANWSDFAGGYAVCQYRRVNGRVELAGLCKYTGAGSGSGTVIGTMPAGFRSAGGKRMVMMQGNGGALRVDLDNATGTLSVVAVLTAGATGALCSFDGIWWPA